MFHFFARLGGSGEEIALALTLPLGPFMGDGDGSLADAEESVWGILESFSPRMDPSVSHGGGIDGYATEGEYSRTYLEELLDIYIQEFTPLLSRSITFCEVAIIATSANGFCEGFMAFFAKFARTLAKFARIGSRHLGQRVPALRKTAKVCLPERVYSFAGLSNTICCIRWRLHAIERPT